MLRIIEPKQFTSPSTEYGKRLESTALEKYTIEQHQDITVCSAGFVIYAEKPYLGATPDAYIHDPHRKEQYGLVEIKCPYKYRNVNICCPGQFVYIICALVNSLCGYLLRTLHLYSLTSNLKTKPTCLTI